MKIKFQESFKKEIVKLSVFVVTYNQEKYIQECLDSILMQKTSFPFEVIVGDDDSSDSTRKICEKYANDYSNVNLLPHEKNLGLVENWVRVLSNCKGEYIALCEGDDYWIDSYKLQKQVDFLEKNNIYSMCVSNRKILIPDGTFNDDIATKKYYTKEDILNGVIPHTQTMVFRNSNNSAMCKFLVKVLEGLLSDGDRTLAYWCSLVGDIYILPDITAVYRWNGIGVWSSHSEVYREFFSIKMFCNFHKRIDYPDRKLFCTCITNQCLDFIYYNIRRKIKNKYKFETCKLFLKELSFKEIFIYTSVYLKNKFHKNKSM